MPCSTRTETRRAAAAPISAASTPAPPTSCSAAAASCKCVSCGTGIRCCFSHRASAFDSRNTKNESRVALRRTQSHGGKGGVEGGGGEWRWGGGGGRGGRLAHLTMAAGSAFAAVWGLAPPFPLDSPALFGARPFLCSSASCAICHASRHHHWQNGNTARHPLAPSPPPPSSWRHPASSCTQQPPPPPSAACAPRPVLPFRLPTVANGHLRLRKSAPHVPARCRPRPPPPP
jgi:hypothetical protein